MQKGQLIDGQHPLIIVEGISPGQNPDDFEIFTSEAEFWNYVNSHADYKFRVWRAQEVKLEPAERVIEWKLKSE